MAPDSDDDTLASLFNSPRVGGGAEEGVSVEVESSDMARLSKLRRSKKSPVASADEEEELVFNNEPNAQDEDVAEDGE